MKYDQKPSFFYWASQSLIGHVVFFQIVASPLFFYFLADDYAEHVVSPARTISLVFLVSGLGLFVAIMGWYTVSKPMIDRRKRDN
jgi:hypothetical protein